ncbi:hypothetical protein LA635_1471 [Erwinia amylovora LA635]|nr:hypothetical protein LA635_1471 [Erwinia amylovora LA635]CDK18463.1 hypothetical protein LA636_1471 [Erwinia amylovora LA636]CDK21832.1 hypothetical protein LA637_1472 [Erwinia amylovora LA637]
MMYLSLSVCRSMLDTGKLGRLYLFIANVS